MQRRDEFDALDELRKTGPLPRELEERHQRLRRQQFFKAGLMCDRYLPSLPSRLVPAEMSAGEWLRAKWASADATVRHSLRAIADSLGVPLPLRRTRHVAGQDSSGSQRSETDQQPNHGESARSEERQLIDPCSLT